MGDGLVALVQLSGHPARIILCGCSTSIALIKDLATRRRLLQPLGGQKS
jgi:hypothetical protein